MTDMLRHFNVEPHKDHTFTNHLITLPRTKIEMKYLHGIYVMCIIKKQSHDDVIKWKHFPRYWPFVRGIHRSPVNSPQRPVTRRFDVFFDLRLNKRLNKQSWGWWFETPSRPLWRQCDAVSASIPIFHAVIMGMSEKCMYNFHHIRVDRLRVNRAKYRIGRILEFAVVALCLAMQFSDRWPLLWYHMYLIYKSYYDMFRRLRWKYASWY